MFYDIDLPGWRLNKCIPKANNRKLIRGRKLWTKLGRDSINKHFSTQSDGEIFKSDWYSLEHPQYPRKSFLTFTIE